MQITINITSKLKTTFLLKIIYSDIVRVWKSMSDSERKRLFKWKKYFWLSRTIFGINLESILREFWENFERIYGEFGEFIEN